jgi:ankyrin repeat protein
MKTELHDAAARGDREFVRKLLESGADPNACDERGCTALHAALRGMHLQVARMLIAAGASLDACDGEGISPRQIAATMPLWEGEA